jgi:flagellar hook-associated protein 1 FlgK
MTEELVWQVNLLHSQGAGLNFASDVTGTYTVLDASQSLSDAASGLAYRDKLQSGSSMLYVYDSAGLVNGQGYAIDFGAAAGQQNFDPTSMSLNDVRTAVERTLTGAGLTAGTDFNVTVTNGALRIGMAGGYSLGFGQDSTGLYAALGLNTYFQGSKAGDVELNTSVATDRSLICAGHINGAGEANEGDNTMALAIGGLETKTIDFSTVAEGKSSQTLSEFFHTLVSTVGADTASAEFNHQYQKALADDLDARQQSVSGVNLDEEMTNLVRFQHSYTAASKLITTADEMMQVLLGLKA